MSGLGVERRIQRAEILKKIIALTNITLSHLGNITSPILACPSNMKSHFAFSSSGHGKGGCLVNTTNLPVLKYN